MYIHYNALKDATIYSLQPDQNTGRDEILEINKTLKFFLEIFNISVNILK